MTCDDCDEQIKTSGRGAGHTSKSVWSDMLESAQDGVLIPTLRECEIRGVPRDVVEFAVTKHPLRRPDL